MGKRMRKKKEATDSPKTKILKRILEQELLTLQRRLEAEGLLERTEIITVHVAFRGTRTGTERTVDKAVHTSGKWQPDETYRVTNADWELVLGLPCFSSALSAGRINATYLEYLRYIREWQSTARPPLPKRWPPHYPSEINKLLEGAGAEFRLSAAVSRSPRLYRMR